MVTHKARKIGIHSVFLFCVSYISYHNSVPYRSYFSDKFFDHPKWKWKPAKFSSCCLHFRWLIRIHQEFGNAQREVSKMSYKNTAYLFLTSVGLLSEPHWSSTHFGFLFRNLVDWRYKVCENLMGTLDHLSFMDIRYFSRKVSKNEETCLGHISILRAFLSNRFFIRLAISM